MGKDEKTEKVTAITKNLRIEWVIPDNLEPKYATNMTVQHTDQEFVISFFQIKQPLILGTQEERKKALESIETTKAFCVAQIVLTPKRVEEFVKVLTTNMQRHQGKQE